MTIIKKGEPNAIQELYNNAGCIIEADTIYIVRDGDKVLATDAEITAIQNKVAEYDVEWTANEYARNREREYPNWGIQLNKIYDDGIDAWKTDMVDPVKAKYPKP